MLGEFVAILSTIFGTISSFLYMSILVDCSPVLLNFIKDTYAALIFGIVILIS